MITRLVLFGASGDLTSRFLMPAFAELADADLLPPDLTITGSATTEWTGEEFREHVADALREHAPGTSAAGRDQVVAALDYRPSDITDATSVAAVLGDRPGPSLVYLALPSVILESAIPALAAAGLAAGDALAVEKPFGTDLASAQRLNRGLRTSLPDTTIFRIDHFLSDELVRRIISLRFLNRTFEPLLNAQHVERVDIGWFESLALEGRAAYYDRAGAMKDMLQNHLMAALSLLTMEQPARFEDASLRGARVEALRSIPTPTRDHIVDRTMRARYTAGTIGDQRVPAYVDEPGVDPTRSTETYAAVSVELENLRWCGVPFTLRSGKAMAVDAGEIAVHFRELPPYLDDLVGELEPNVLRIGLMEPYVRLDLMLNSDVGPRPQHLELISGPRGRSAYANLLLAALASEPMLFIRDDEVEESWRVIDPIATAWAADEVPMLEYAAGSRPSDVASTDPTR